MLTATQARLIQQKSTEPSQEKIAALMDIVERKIRDAASLGSRCIENPLGGIRMSITAADEEAVRRALMDAGYSVGLETRGYASLGRGVMVVSW
jgi:hypothetical protein